MNIKKLIKTGAIALSLGLVITGGVVYYMFNMPHRNIETSNTDYELTSKQLVSEYLQDFNTANDKFLDEDGESKILEISGTISSIDLDFNNQVVVLLKEENDKAGVSCTFVVEANQQVASLSIGTKIKIKGVIRAGASFDKDLDMYEHVILDKCTLIN